MMVINKQIRQRAYGSGTTMLLFNVVAIEISGCACKYPP